MSTHTPAPFVLQPAHARRSAEIQATLMDLLPRHLNVAHALQRQRDSASENDLQQWQSELESSFATIAELVEERSRLDAAANWISEHAHLVQATA